MSLCDLCNITVLKDNFFLKQSAPFLRIRDISVRFLLRNQACSGTMNHSHNAAKPSTTVDVEEPRTDTQAVRNVFDLAVVLVRSTLDIIHVPYAALLDGCSTSTPEPAIKFALVVVMAETITTSGLILSANPPVDHTPIAAHLDHHFSEWVQQTWPEGLPHQDGEILPKTWSPVGDNNQNDESRIKL